MGEKIELLVSVSCVGGVRTLLLSLTMTVSSFVDADFSFSNGLVLNQTDQQIIPNFSGVCVLLLSKRHSMMAL